MDPVAVVVVLADDIITGALVESARMCIIASVYYVVCP